jgi:hypothetical protein
MKELFYGFYGTWIYLPMSDLSRRWRRMRQKQGKFLQQVKLPKISWRKCTSHRAIKIWEHGKANGNIRISELGVINAIAAGRENGTNIFEIGTFDGRTSLNISFSAPVDCKIYTLDLPPDEKPQYSLASGKGTWWTRIDPAGGLRNTPILTPKLLARFTHCMGTPPRLIFRHTTTHVPWCLLMGRMPMIMRWLTLPRQSAW